jgi:hypothetical protein
LLPPGFATQNVYGQTYEIWLKKTGTSLIPPRLEGLVLTTGGTTPLSVSRATEIATRTDAGDGGVVDASGTVNGAYGAWQVNLQSYRDNGGVLTPPAGVHVAALLRFDDSRAYADYIHRFPIGGGSEPQTMHTSLNMGQYRIDNADDVTVRYSIGLTPDNSIPVNGSCSGKEGRVASASGGEPVICVVEPPAGTSVWRRVALLPKCTQGQFISVGSDGRLSCA